MKTPTHGLIAIDGVNGIAVDAAARGLAAERGGRHAVISTWNASRIFGELRLAEAGGTRPSARTLVLLYAADLAYRLRWDVRPALEQGRTVIVAPYVSTALAFGRAAGLEASSLHGVFAFAPEPEESDVIEHPIGPRNTSPAGFIEFARDQILGERTKASRRALAKRLTHTLKTIAAQHKRG